MAKTSIKNQIAIVGGETLLGRELREVLKEAGLDSRIRLISGGDVEGRAITEEEGEAVLLEVLDLDTLTGSGAVLLAGT
ncbi:MAG TPA: hypothetical protein VLT57_16040, partial [Bryobacteraceae bacterium]|nr:hypothetical protein [Bryobacteraceae bacterium]